MNPMNPYEPLSDADVADLRESYRNLDDIDPHTVERAQDGFRRAYAVAQGIVDGRIDPLGPTR